MIIVTHGETYDRPLRWWICISLFSFLIVAISLRKADWRGVILLLLFISTYVWYDRKLKHEKYKLDLDMTGIKIGNDVIPRDTISAYSLMHGSDKTELRTLYLYKAQDVDILTLHASQAEISDLGETLADILPLKSTLDLSGVRKLLKFLRI